MKKLYYLFIAAMAITFGSCDESTRLARNVCGTWAGTPESLESGNVSSSTIIESYIFTAGDEQTGPKGGNITITGNVSSTIPVASDNPATGQASISVAATTSIQGTWVAIDDDEISLNLDSRTIQVKIDPDAVMVTNDLMSESGNQAIDSLSTQVISGITRQIHSAIEMRYMSIRHLDDVKIKGPLMKFEISDIDYVLTRQGNVE